MYSGCGAKQLYFSFKSFRTWQRKVNSDSNEKLDFRNHCAVPVPNIGEYLTFLCCTLEPIDEFSTF